MTHTRRGFSLIELLVAMILLFIVGGGIYSLLITVQRVSKRQTEMANVQGNLRSGIQLVQSELQELFNDTGNNRSDISTMSATAITYLAPRGMGEICGTPTASTILVRKPTYWGYREPAGGRDGIMIYLDSDTTKITDDDWIPKLISSVGTSTCPDNNDAAYSLSLASNLSGSQVTALMAVTDYPGAGLGAIPIRIYEPMQMGQVTDAGQVWLGIRSVNLGSDASLVPVIGPLTSSGVDFTYLASDGSSTTSTSAVKTIRLTLRGISDRAVTTGLGSAIGTPQDSLRITIQLRNSR